MGQGSIIGYEINEKTCQISFYNEEELEPDTLETVLRLKILIALR